MPTWGFMNKRKTSLENLWDHQNIISMSDGDITVEVPKKILGLSHQCVKCPPADTELFFEDDLRSNFSGLWWYEVLQIIHLVGGLVAINFIFPEILGLCHHPNWRTHMFQRGGPTTNQIYLALSCLVKKGLGTPRRCNLNTQKDQSCSAPLVGKWLHRYWMILAGLLKLVMVSLYTLPISHPHVYIWWYNQQHDT